MKTIDETLRYAVVKKILDGDLDSALRLLSDQYGVSTPSFRVGTVKGHRRCLACYMEKHKAIVFANSEALRSPRVVLHEFYHHLIASTTLKGGGTDKDAERFVRRFLRPPTRPQANHG
jgi:hypothetical protein